VVGEGGGAPPFAWKITWCPWAAPPILAKARRLQLADASFREKDKAERQVWRKSRQVGLTQNKHRVAAELCAQESAAKPPKPQFQYVPSLSKSDHDPRPFWNCHTADLPLSSFEARMRHVCIAKDGLVMVGSSAIFRRRISSETSPKMHEVVKTKPFVRDVIQKSRYIKI